MQGNQVFSEAIKRRLDELDNDTDWVETWNLSPNEINKKIKSTLADLMEALETGNDDEILKTTVEIAVVCDRTFSIYFDQASICHGCLSLSNNCSKGGEQVTPFSPSCSDKINEK